MHALKLISNQINQITIGASKRCDCQDSNQRLKELSKTLQNKLQQLGQLSCEFAKHDTSVNGGWCAKISGSDSVEHETDKTLVPYLSKFLMGNY